MTVAVRTARCLRTCYCTISFGYSGACGGTDRSARGTTNTCTATTSPSSNRTYTSFVLLTRLLIYYQMNQRVSLDQTKNQLCSAVFQIGLYIINSIIESLYLVIMIFLVKKIKVFVKCKLLIYLNFKLSIR